MKDLVKLQPELKKKILTANQQKLNNFSLGKNGEQLACKYLIKKNYEVLDGNIRVKNNEIDIIALDKNCNEIAFIEVKTRKSAEFGTPALAVSNKKLKSMAFVAKEYLRQTRCNLDFRFDIIAISCFGGSHESGENVKIAKKGIVAKPKIEHFKNVSWP